MACLSPQCSIFQRLQWKCGLGFVSHLKAHLRQDLLPRSLTSLLAGFSSSRVVGLRASSSFRSLPGGPQGKHRQSNLPSLWLYSLTRSESLGPAHSQGGCRGCECREVGVTGAAAEAACHGACSLPGVLVTLWIIDRLGRKKTMALCFAVFSFCSLLLFICVGRWAVISRAVVGGSLGLWVVDCTLWGSPEGLPPAPQWD